MLLNENQEFPILRASFLHFFDWVLKISKIMKYYTANKIDLGRAKI